MADHKYHNEYRFSDECPTCIMEGWALPKFPRAELNLDRYFAMARESANTPMIGEYEPTDDDNGQES